MVMTQRVAGRPGGRQHHHPAPPCRSESRDRRQVRVCPPRQCRCLGFGVDARAARAGGGQTLSEATPSDRLRLDPGTGREHLVRRNTDLTEDWRVRQNSR